MAQPKTINAPDWDDPPGTEEFKQAEGEYDPFAKDLKELAGLVSEADTIFTDCLAKKKGLPEGKDTVIIKTKGFRYVAYYTCDSAGNAVPFFQHTDELLQSSVTYKPVMRILHSVRKLKLDFEGGIGTDNAARLYEDLENALRFLWIPDHAELNSGTTTTNRDYDKQQQGWHFVGDNKDGSVGPRAMDRILAKIKECQERLNRIAGTDASKANAKMPCRFRKAEDNYKEAMEKARQAGKELRTDKQVYDWFKNNECSQHDSDMPDFDTWERYLRGARSHRMKQQSIALKNINTTPH